MGMEPIYHTEDGRFVNIKRYQGMTAQDAEEIYGEIGQQAVGVNNALKWFERKIEEAEGRMKDVWRQRLRRYNQWRKKVAIQ